MELNGSYCKYMDKAIIMVVCNCSMPMYCNIFIITVVGKMCLDLGVLRSKINYAWK